MQAILPGKIRSWKPDLLEGTGDGLSVGDMQHQEEATMHNRYLVFSTWYLAVC